MSIVRKVRAVERIFAALDREVESFRQSTRLHCVAGCGFCCNKPDIEASVIEFLPLAHDFFIKEQAEAVWSFLRNDPQPVCHLFSPGIIMDAGFCNGYVNRGLICRLFGFSARKDKYGKREFTTCKKIKEKQPQQYLDACLGVKIDIAIPVISDYYTKLLRVDFELARQTYPVNIAIRKAIEVVLSHYAYRRKPSRKRITDQNIGTIPNPGLSQDLISGPQ